jgi:hypothetical protein
VAVSRHPSINFAPTRRWVSTQDVGREKKPVHITEQELLSSDYVEYGEEEEEGQGQEQVPEQEQEEEEEKLEEAEDDLYDPNEAAKLAEEKDLFFKSVYSSPGAKLQQHMVNNGISPENAAKYVR